MAANQETPQVGNFSIEDTMEMGFGNTELLNDLMGPETSTSSPEDVQKIAEPAPEKPAEKKEKEEKKDTTKSIQDFLMDSDDDEEEEEEVEKDVKSAKATETTEEDVEDGEEETSRFGALANDLFKLGVFSKDDDEEDVQISTPEEFLERFTAEKKKGAIEIVQNFIGQFGEDYQDAFDAIFVKGVNPKEYFSVYNNIDNFSELDLSREENQVAVLRQALTDQGFDSEDIDTEIERLKNYGDLETVSQKHHKVLVKKEAAKLQQLEQQREQQLQKQAAIRNQYINNVQTILQEKVKTKEFDGIPLNPKIANELQDYLLAEKYQTPSGEKLTEFDRQILELKRPENHGLKVKVGLLMKLLETDPTLSTIQKRGVTSKSNELFSEVARQTTKAAKSTSSKGKPTSWFQ
jgi:hypothetical protein